MPHRAPVSRVALSLWMALLLLWQTLGHMHGVLHAPALRGRAPAALAQGAPAPAATASTVVVALVGAHNDDSVCRLLDQLGSGQALALALPVLPVVVPVVCEVARSPRGVATRWVALFDARGPPSFR